MLFLPGQAACLPLCVLGKEMESSNLTTWHKFVFVRRRRKETEGGKKRGWLDANTVCERTGDGGESGISDKRRAEISDRRDKRCSVRLVELTRQMNK